MDSATTTVEIDTALLERLRDRWPGKTDRELLESAAHIRLGRTAISEVQTRAGLSDEDAIKLGVNAVRKARP